MAELIETIKAPPEPESKKPWESKTLWINVIMAAAAFFPKAQEYMASNPEAVSTGMILVNILLRLVSKDKIALK